VREKYTKQIDGEQVLRHRQDDIFATSCKFLDGETRQCTVYEHRPGICRRFPGTARCGYYDFLAFERRRQDDPEYIALT
jgi:Fe-S-cluster containining protein